MQAGAGVYEGGGWKGQLQKKVNLKREGVWRTTDGKWFPQKQAQRKSKKTLIISDQHSLF